MYAKQFPYPTDGWISCPVEGCTCFGTWSVDEASRPEMERYRAEFVAAGGQVRFSEPDT